MGGSTPLLTTHGVRQLSQDSTGAAIRLQVLGTYRYLADPALKERLGQPFEDARDVFDVLLSDGRHKIKAVLAPKLHNLVWTRQLRARSCIRVTKFKVFSEDLEDDTQQQRVVVLQEITISPLDNDGVLPDKVVARRYGTQQDENQLQFLCASNPREVELIPLVGERVYYLPLQSDHYTLDWACSFTGGVPEEDSPLDELENNWTSSDGSWNAGQETIISSVRWSIDPEVGTDLFTPEFKKLHTILEALEKIKENQDGPSDQLNPPMVGAIRVKSKLMNLADPNISNPFPFMFNAVVVDATGVFEVAFFGSMCAKYFLSLREGDLVQFRGYCAVGPQELQWTTTTSPLIVYEHESSGSALHVPKKYWKFLEMTNVGPHLLGDASQFSQQAGSCGLAQLRPSWLECSFVNTLNTLYWGKNAITDLGIMYFDFVGVLSNVGRICRERKRKLDDDTPEVTEYRWVKMIDSSSSHEIVIKLSECSQPAVFRSLEAGNTLMITKLQWVMLPGPDTGKRIQYAMTSVFSVLRMNEAVLPFHSIEECNLNVYFANNVRKNAVHSSRKVLGESKLGAHIEKKYRPRNRHPTDVEDFKKAFGLKVCLFSDLSLLLLHMEACEHQHVGVIGQVKAISSGDSVLLVLNESKNTDRMLTVEVNINALYQRPAIKVVDEIYSTRTRNSRLSLEIIEEHLVNSKRDYFFSLQLYRDGIGHVTWEVDAILAMP